MPASPGERGCGWAAGCEPAGLVVLCNQGGRLPAAQPRGGSGRPPPAVRSLHCLEPVRAGAGEREREKVPEFIEEDSLKPKEEKEAVPSLGRPSLGSLLQVPGICF